MSPQSATASAGGLFHVKKKNYTQLVYPSQHNAVVLSRCKSKRCCALVSDNKQVNTSGASKDNQIDRHWQLPDTETTLPLPDRLNTTIKSTNIGEQNPSKLEV